MAAIDTTGNGVGQWGLLARERIIAKPGFNRWLVPPAALHRHGLWLQRILAASLALDRHQ